MPISSPDRPTLRRFRIRLGLGALVLNAVVILIVVLSLQQSWRIHEAQAVATAQNLALALDRYVSETFSKADLAVLAIKDEVELGLASPALPRQDLDAFMRRHYERTGGMLALRTADAQGRVDHGSGQEAGSGVSVEDRPYFRRLRDDPSAGLVISEPLVSRMSGQWVIVMARRLEGPGDRFAGVVWAALTLDQFQRAFAELDVGPHGSVAIRSQNLGLVARYPEAAAAGTAIGQSLVSDAFRAFAGTGQVSGAFRTQTPFDGILRTFAIRRVTGHPFILVIGLAPQDYLVPWYREVLREVLGAGLFLALSLVAFWQIERGWRRQRAAQEYLESLLAQVKTLGGLLPICSHCKKIRDDHGYWNQIEAYLNQHTDAEFTHGICPDCAREFFPKSERSAANHGADHG